MLVFANEMMGEVQRPCNPKPQQEGGDRDRGRDRERERKQVR
jgi:hypothetical protein